MKNKLEDLIERHLNDELNADEKNELAEKLDSNPEARKALVEHAEFNSAVTSVLKSKNGEDLLPVIEFPKKHPLKVLLPWVVAVAACLLVFMRTSEVTVAPEDEVVKIEDTEKVLTAILVNEANAEFSSGRSIDDVKFTPGMYELTAGAVHLRFSSGADLVVEAPAKFQIFDDMNTQLVSGKVRAMVPPSAHGFTVSTTGVSYEDIGTEFGLKVNDAGNSELHVFDGQVNVKDPSTNKLLKKVFKGQAVAYADGQKASDQKFQPDGFLGMGEIGYLRWKKQMDDWAKNPDVLACFPFIENEANLLLNTADARISDGHISGAKWTSGRWQGKGSLLFDKNSDYAEIDIPFELNEMSVSMWIKVDRLDNSLNAVLNSNGWEAGDIHIQLFRQQLPHFDINGKGQSITKISDLKEIDTTPISLSKWIHLTSVFSVKNKTARMYVNGKLYVSAELRKEHFIKPGRCRLGNWLSSPGYEPNRAFKGRIDELVIWKKALSEKEIKAQVETGRPSVLWSVDN